MAFTFFFRDQKPLEHAVAFLKVSAAGRSRIRIWDAGCAMGQEPYTLAILLSEQMGTFAFRNVQIYATDYDAPLLKVLQDGVYPFEELQRIPKAFFEKYFLPNGRKGYFLVADAIRQRVSAHLHDLLTLEPPMSGFSLIVCKNVLLHFSYDQRVDILKMFHTALEPDGLIVMEHTQKMPEELYRHFEKLVGDAQVYRKRKAAS